MDVKLRENDKECVADTFLLERPQQNFEIMADEMIHH